MRALLFLTVIACEVDVKAPDTSDTSDTGGPTETHSPGAPAPCPASTAFTAVGDTWIYTRTFAGVPGTEQVEITSLDPSTGALRVSSLFELDGDALRVESTTDYLCAEDGLYGVQISAETFDGVTGETSSSIETFDPPAFVMPSTMAVGTTWSDRWRSTLTTEDPDLGTTTVDVESVRAYEVTAEEDVETEAGTFTALRVEVLADDPATVWFVEGVGKVKSEESWQTESLRSR